MNRYDRSVTGANTGETILNTHNVNATGFGKLYSYYVDGAVYGQPLYVHNVLYVATMNDKVYAFDADQSGPPLWMRNFTDEMAGVTPVPAADITNRNDLNVVGNAGIESTPVIDAAARAIYVLARTKENGAYVQRLHKLDLKSGKELLAPVIIQASVQGVAFDPRAGNQRAALALVQGNIVIAWASHEDIKPYHGWVMAYDAATLRQTAVFCSTPTGSLGGIWQSGRGPAVDATGAIYFEVGNGSWDGTSNFGTSVLKLRIQSGQFKVEDSFTPPDYEALNQRDSDLGSTGPLLIPGTNFLLCGEKRGELFLLDTGKLNHLIQSVPLKGGRILAGPVYWDGPAGPSIYQWGESDFAKGFHFRNGALDPTPYAVGTIASHGSPGGALTLSANGKEPGAGIVWATLTTGKSADHGNAAGVLRALNAETLEELWNSEANPKRDRLGTLVKFVPPLVVEGRVYVPNYDNAVVVYGVLHD
jgi:outer membrane protein assembly factor BamB